MLLTQRCEDALEQGLGDRDLECRASSKCLELVTLEKIVDGIERASSTTIANHWKLVEGFVELFPAAVPRTKMIEKSSLPIKNDSKYRRSFVVSSFA